MNENENEKNCIISPADMNEHNVGLSYGFKITL